MIDLHNHILPGVDDGARDLSEALEMAEMAVAQGTTVLAATPHRFSRGKEYDGAFVERAVAKLQTQLDKHSVPLRLVPGLELPMRSNTVELLQSGQLIPLGGSAGKTVLIEPPFETIPAAALVLLQRLQSCGFQPLLAHPERNSEVQQNLAFVESCIALGMTVQLTAGSVLGKFGPSARNAARKIALHRDWKIILASDAHEQYDRTPGDMLLAVETVAQWLGDDADAQMIARRMVEETPRGLLPDAL